MKQKLLLLMFVLASTVSLKAQVITGTLYSKRDNTFIEGAHIVNTSQNKMAISSASGIFNLQAKAGDTVVISNINFNTKQLIVSDAKEVDIWLNPADIQLGEVVVSNMPASEAAFKKRIVDMPMQDNGHFVPFGVTPGKPMAKIPINYDRSVTNSLRYAAAKPVSFIVKKLSKSHKEKVKYYETVAAQESNIRLEKKYNRELVAYLTGLKDEELTNFIDFADLDNSFLSTASEYEIAARIVEEYEYYQEYLMNKDSDKG